MSVPQLGDVMRTFVLGLCASFLLFGCADDGSEPGGDSDASSADVTDGSGGDSTDAGAEEDTAPEEDVTPEEDVAPEQDVTPEEDVAPEEDAGDQDAADGGDETDVDEPAPSCPPAGPFGTALGETLPNATATLCDGSVISVYDLCELDAAAVVTFADWCPTCRGRTEDLQTGYEGRAGDAFEMLFVVTENASFGAEGQDFCIEIQERYGLSMLVAFDDDGAFRDALDLPSNAATVVFSDGMTVLQNEQGVTAEAMFEVVDAALAD